MGGFKMALVYFTLIIILLVLIVREIKYKKEIELYRCIKEGHDKLLQKLDEVLKESRND